MTTSRRGVAMLAEPQSSPRMDAAGRREQILAHATRMFAERPYASVMMRDIAAAAGIARPLIHHYFDTKRDLYLEALERLAFIPIAAIDEIPDGDLEARVSASIDRWLGVAERHRYLWLTIITIPAGGGDPDVDAILREAESIASLRVIQATRLDEAGVDSHRLTILVTAFGGMARAACREWLRDGSLSREDVHVLLSRILLAIVAEVAPALSDVQEATIGS